MKYMVASAIAIVLLVLVGGGVIYYQDHNLTMDKGVNVYMNTNPDQDSNATGTNANGGESVVNWDKPSKKDLVERAVSDGVTDPTKIVEFAKDHDVTMTVEEVEQIEATIHNH